MTRLLLLLILAAFLPLAAGESNAAPPHSASVEAVSHTPTAPHRGQDVAIRLVTQPGAGVDRILLNYCTADTSVCAFPSEMVPVSSTDWVGDIPWSKPQENRFPEFWDGVSEVGYRFLLRHRDGGNETSPVRNWPDTPPDFQLTTHYYFYRIEDAAPSNPLPTLGGAFALVALVALPLAFSRSR